MNKIFKEGLLTLLFVCFVNANEFNSAVLLNTNILKNEAVQKIDEIGLELYEKTGLSLALAVSDELGLNELKKFKNQLKAPYILLLMSIKDKKIKVENSNDIENIIDNEEILENSVYPLLGQKKIYFDAALLNGYADFSEKIAKHFNITLENSIGNTNRNVLNFMRIIFWSFVAYFIIIYVFKKFRNTKNAIK